MTGESPWRHPSAVTRSQGSRQADRPARAGMLANLNVFIAVYGLAATTLAGPVGLLLSSLSLLVIGRDGYAIWFLASHALVALALLAVWWKTGLSPSNPSPGRAKRLRAGHWVLGVTNLLSIVAMVAPFLAAKVTGAPGMMMLLWFVVPVYTLACLAWAAGLAMVWSSRANIEA